MSRGCGLRLRVAARVQRYWFQLQLWSHYVRVLNGRFGLSITCITFARYFFEPYFCHRVLLGLCRRPSDPYAEQDRLCLFIQRLFVYTQSCPQHMFPGLRYDFLFPLLRQAPPPQVSPDFYPQLLWLSP